MAWFWRVSLCWLLCWGGHAAAATAVLLADQALYQAKASGRDCARMAEATPP